MNYLSIDAVPHCETHTNMDDFSEISHNTTQSYLWVLIIHELVYQYWSVILSIFISKEVANSGNTLFIAILGLFTPCDLCVGGFNTTSRVPYITIPLSFDNTRSCASMVKCVYLKEVGNIGNTLFFSHSVTFHTLWWFCGGFQHYLQSPVYSHISEFW